jgi:hypothetical protein
MPVHDDGPVHRARTRRRGAHERRAAALSGLAVLALGVAPSGCREGVLENVNHAPVVQSIVATPTLVVTGQEVVLRAEATDEDGDGLRYFWSAEAGAFDVVFGESVRWTAPSSPGDYEIQVNASDLTASTTATVRIRVGAPRAATPR